MMTIRCENICPPIPVSSMDWAAWVDGDEEGPTGRGATHNAAMADLFEQLGEKFLEALR
jgi:hypothetical protein